MILQEGILIEVLNNIKEKGEKHDKYDNEYF